MTTEYCLKNPERCKGYDDPLTRSTHTMPDGTIMDGATHLRTEPILKKKNIYHTDPALQTNRAVSRPDLQTSRLFNQAKEKISEYSNNTKLGSNVIEHTPEEVLNSHLSQGAYETAYNGKEATRKLIKEGSKLVPELGDFQVVNKGRFTNNNHTTFYNPKTNKVYISFRGSDANFADPQANLESVIKGTGNRVKNATDWGINLHTLVGKEHTTNRYKEAVSTAKAVAKFFNIPVENVNLTGHSLGGGQADHVAEVLGAKSVSFNPARNPLAKRPVNPKAEITTHSTLYDPVSLPRNLHEKVAGVPEHIKKNIITSSLGQEGGWVNQHDLMGQFIEPLHLHEGKIKSVRTNTLRNTAGMITSQGEAVGRQLTGGLGGLILPYALTPEYPTQKEKNYRIAESYAENLKINTALSPALYRINPMYALIDTPALMTDIMSIDPMLPEGAKDLIREKLGLPKKEVKLEYQEPPRIINWINKKLDPITGRYTADQQLKDDIQQANNLNVSLERYLNYTEADGDYFAGSGVQAKGVLKYNTDEANDVAQKYHN